MITILEKDLELLKRRIGYNPAGYPEEKESLKSLAEEFNLTEAKIKSRNDKTIRRLLDMYYECEEGMSSINKDSGIEYVFASSIVVSTLRCMGVNKIRDLSKHSLSEYVMMPRLGKADIVELITICDRYGIELASI